MQQYVIVFSVLISIALAQPCNVWPDQRDCINAGCAWCNSKCSYTPPPNTLCHYGDTVPQPVALKAGTTYVSVASLNINNPTYYGYDLYTFNVQDTSAGFIRIRVQQYTANTATSYVSQKVDQPSPSEYSWSFVNSTKIPASSLATGLLYIGVLNNGGTGYGITVSPE